MGYTPKYARGENRVSPLSAILIVVFALISLGLAALLLRGVAMIPGSAAQTAQPAEPAIMEKFENHMDTALADTMTLFAPVAQEEVPAETVPEEVPEETQPAIVLVFPEESE